MIKWLSFPPRRAAIALCALPGAYWLRDGRRAFASALPRMEVRSVDPEPSFAGERHLGAVSFPRWVGVLPYEAFRAIEGRAELQRDRRPAAIGSECRWLRYGAALVFEEGRVGVAGETEADVLELERAIERAPSSPEEAVLSWLEPPEPDDVHAARIAHALSAIGRGDLYQVNLARRLRLRSRGHPIALLSRLGPPEGAEDLGGARFGFALDLGDFQCVSLSPELCLDLTPEGLVSTSPIKGTRPRASDPAEDRALGRELDESEKERAELTMVIDLERNDLARVARVGSVRVTAPPRVITHPTVHHREATVSAKLRPGVTRKELLDVMLPSGSVTGAPKRAAMATIRELEGQRRGLYTGGIGYLGQNGGLRLSMAIRMLAIQGDVGEYLVGGGIVADSDPIRETEETRWKAEQLRRLVRGRFA